MTAITDAKQQIQTQLDQLKQWHKVTLPTLTDGKLGAIQYARIKAFQLLLLCNNIREGERQPYVDAVNKLQTKLTFSERVADFQRDGGKNADPRVEKLFGKLSQKPLPTQMAEFANWEAKLSGWQQKLEKLSTGWNNNQPTKQMAEKGKSMLKCQMAIGELRKEALTDKPLPNFASCLIQTPEGLWNTSKSNIVPGPFNVSTYAFAIEPVSKEKMKPFLLFLEKFVAAISPQDQTDFFHAVESAAINSDVTQIDREIKVVLARLCDHLFCIQNKETPDKIDRKDRLWDTNALLSSKLSTQEQKVRAAERLQVEALLQLLLLAFEREDNEQARELLDVLEKLKLDAKDLSGGATNIAHQLFGKLLCYHADARNKDLSLENPYDQKFKREFGRLAFTGVTNACPISFKKAAIGEVLGDLHSFWGL